MSHVSWSHVTLVSRLASHVKTSPPTPFPRRTPQRVLGLERIDGRDTAIHLPVIQVFRENRIASKPFGCGHDLRIVILNAVDALYLDRSGDKRIVIGSPSFDQK